MTLSPQPFVVALVQRAPVFLNLEATVALAESTVAECAAEGARVVVLPETWLPGYPVWIDAAPGAALWDQPGAKALYRHLRENAYAIDGDAHRRLGAAADAACVVLFAGAHERRGATLYNSTIMFDGRGSFAVHRKLTPTYTERLLWGQGDGSTLSALQTELGTIGGLICWEHWLPLARAAMHAQHELLHVAQWPWVKEMHQVCSRQYAFEGQCYVAASGCVLSRDAMLHGARSLPGLDGAALELLQAIPAPEDDLLLRGGSLLIGPDGSPVAGSAEGDDSTVYGEVDRRRVDEGRLYLDTDGHYSRPDVFQLHVDTTERANVTFGGQPAPV